MGFLNFLGAAGGFLGSLVNAGTQIGTTAMGVNASKAQQAAEQQWAANQADINRQFQSDEAAIARDFNAREAALNRGFQTSEREAAQTFNREMFDLETARNKEMWNLENEYNSPKAQLQRAMEAGMNPNAIIGNMSSVGQAGSIASAGPVRSSGQSGSQASAPGVPGGAQAQAGSIANTIGELIGNSASTFWQSELVKNQAEGQRIQNDYDTATFDERVAMVTAQKDKIMSELKLNEQQWKQMEELFPYTLSKSQQEIKLMKQQMIHLIQEDKKLAAEIKTEQKRQKQIEAETDLTKAQTETENVLRDEREANLEADTRLKGQQTRLTATQNRQLLWEEGLRDIGFDPESGIGQNIMRSIYENPESKGAEEILGALDNISTVIEIGSWLIPIGAGVKGALWAYRGYKGIQAYRATKAATKAAKAAKAAMNGTMKLGGK